MESEKLAARKRQQRKRQADEYVARIVHRVLGYDPGSARKRLDTLPKRKAGAEQPTKARLPTLAPYKAKVVLDENKSVSLVRSKASNFEKPSERKSGKKRGARKRLRRVKRVSVKGKISKSKKRVLEAPKEVSSSGFLQGLERLDLPSRLVRFNSATPSESPANVRDWPREVLGANQEGTILPDFHTADLQDVQSFPYATPKTKALTRKTLASQTTQTEPQRPVEDRADEQRRSRPEEKEGRDANHPAQGFEYRRGDGVNGVQMLPGAFALPVMAASNGPSPPYMLQPVSKDLSQSTEKLNEAINLLRGEQLMMRHRVEHLTGMLSTLGHNPSRSLTSSTTAKSNGDSEEAIYRVESPKTTRDLRNPKAPKNATRQGSRTCALSAQFSETLQGVRKVDRRTQNRNAKGTGTTKKWRSFETRPASPDKPKRVQENDVEARRPSEVEELDDNDDESVEGDSYSFNYNGDDSFEDSGTAAEEGDWESKGEFSASLERKKLPSNTRHNDFHEEQSAIDGGDAQKSGEDSERPRLRAVQFSPTARSNESNGRVVQRDATPHSSARKAYSLREHSGKDAIVSKLRMRTVQFAVNEEDAEHKTPIPRDVTPHARSQSSIAVIKRRQTGFPVQAPARLRTVQFSPTAESNEERKSAVRRDLTPHARRTPVPKGFHPSEGGDRSEVEEQKSPDDFAAAKPSKPPLLTITAPASESEGDSEFDVESELECELKSEEKIVHVPETAQIDVCGDVPESVQDSPETSLETLQQLFEDAEWRVEQMEFQDSSNGTLVSTNAASTHSAFPTYWHLVPPEKPQSADTLRFVARMRLLRRCRVEVFSQVLADKPAADDEAEAEAEAEAKAVEMKCVQVESDAFGGKVVFQSRRFHSLKSGLERKTPTPSIEVLVTNCALAATAARVADTGMRALLQTLLAQKEEYQGAERIRANLVTVKAKAKGAFAEDGGEEDGVYVEVSSDDRGLLVQEFMGWDSFYAALERSLGDADVEDLSLQRFLGVLVEPNADRPSAKSRGPSAQSGEGAVALER